MDALVSFLITVLILAAVFYLMPDLGAGKLSACPFPSKVIQIAWAIFALLVLLAALYHMFIGSGGNAWISPFALNPNYSIISW